MQALLNLFLSLLLFLVAPSMAAGAGICRNTHVQPKSAPRIHLPSLLGKIDATAAELKGTQDFISPRKWRAKTVSYGLPGLDLPRSVGGRELPPSKMVQVFEHLGKHALDLRDVVGGAHSRPLLQSSSPAVRAIVEQVAQGKGYMAIAITEKDAGSNMRAMKSISEKVDGGYLLTGQKMYNARFLSATHVIVFTQAGDAGLAPGKLNTFVLPISYPGLHFTELNAHGLRGNSFGGVSFDRLFVPEELRIGGHGEGGKVFREHFLYWRLMMAAAAVGTGKGAIEQAVERMRTRDAFGGPIGRFTHLQQELAEHTAKLHMLSLLIHQAAGLLDKQKYSEAASLVAMAKAEGVEWALKASDFAMQLFGAEGYTDLTDLGTRVADLQGLRIADGTTHVMRQEVVRQVYGQDFWNLAIGINEP